MAIKTKEHYTIEVHSEHSMSVLEKPSTYERALALWKDPTFRLDVHARFRSKGAYSLIMCRIKEDGHKQICEEVTYE